MSGLSALYCSENCPGPGPTTASCLLRTLRNGTRFRYRFNSTHLLTKDGHRRNCGAQNHTLGRTSNAAWPWRTRRFNPTPDNLVTPSRPQVIFNIHYYNQIMSFSVMYCLISLHYCISKLSRIPYLETDNLLYVFLEEREWKIFIKIIVGHNIILFLKSLP